MKDYKLLKLSSLAFYGRPYGIGQTIIFLPATLRATHAAGI